MATIKGGEQFQAFLDSLGRKLKDCKLDVGFFPGNEYEDGTNVASVAFWNEFGTGRIPPRPFFRGMISEHQGEWVGKIKVAIKKTDNDTIAAMDLMGEVMVGDLQQSINDLMDPPLSPVTIAKKGFDKPLIDTKLMIDSVTHQVTT